VRHKERKPLDFQFGKAYSTLLEALVELLKEIANLNNHPERQERQEDISQVDTRKSPEIP